MSGPVKVDVLVVGSGAAGPHVANQHGSHSFIVHLITQALNKLNQIRMTEVATLIGTHHLIAGGTQGERLGANDTAIGKRAD